MYSRPFKWWVQSVMPLVFDDSLSYYEVLAKLTKYIEGLTGDVQEIEEILGTIEGIEDVTQFTEFLKNIQTEIGNLSNLSTQSKTNLVSAINEIALKADIAYYKPPDGIPESDLSQSVQDKLNKTGETTKYIINNKELKAAPSNNSPADLGLGTYTVPSGGIPWYTLSQDVRDRIENGGSSEGGTKDYNELSNKPQINGHTLNAGDNTAENLGLGTYSKPSAGIPESDLSAEVQEKLNTSGGIADSETSFVATRDYEAGELIYINNVLYKTKYKILSGTNLVPGNNIEVTDISSEIEEINSNIEALQSGSGPDSWNLSAEVKSESSADIFNFFEYFNCIGGENYYFILDPIIPTAGYGINIHKRDGTSVKYFDNTSYPTYMNRQRFTFTPTATGEYYCTIIKSSAGSNPAHARVTIEYTQSQGISELWAQVNQANQLEPRVGAVETIVEQQETKLGTSIVLSAYQGQDTAANQPVKTWCRIGNTRNISDFPEEIKIHNRAVWLLTLGGETQGLQVLYCATKPYQKLAYRFKGSGIYGSWNALEARYDLYPSDNTDITQNIASHFGSFANKVLKLAPGDYYFNTINLPEGCAIIGAGKEITKLICTNPSTWCAIMMHKNSIIKDISIIYENGFTDENKPTQNYWEGIHGIGIGSNIVNYDNYTDDTNCHIENVNIDGFTGCGIFSACTTQSPSGGSTFSNVKITHCSCGLYLGTHSEFNIVSDSVFTQCYTGIVNLGGNNVYDTGILGWVEIGFRLVESDYYRDKAPNDAHGFLCNFKFSHIGWISGQYGSGDSAVGGYAVIREGNSSAELIANSFLSGPVLAIRGGQNLSLTGCHMRQYGNVYSEGAIIIMTGCCFSTGTDASSTAGGKIYRRACITYTGVTLEDVISSE